MKFDDLNDSELWVIANPIMDNLMDGSTRLTMLSTAEILRGAWRILWRWVSSEGVSSLSAQQWIFAEREPVALFRRSDSSPLFGSKHQ